MATITSNKPEILFLSLAFHRVRGEWYAPLIDDLDKETTSKHARNAIDAIKYLENNNPKAIIVTDEGLPKAEHKPVLDKVVSYVQNGGLVIIGFHFPSFTNFDDIDELFGKAFGLPWLSGDYTRSEIQFNPSSTAPSAIFPMPSPFTMKALRVRNARPEEKIFVPVPVREEETLSTALPPAYVDQTQATVVGVKVGDGYVAYVGDVNAEKESNKIMLSLCGFRST